MRTAVIRNQLRGVFGLESFKEIHVSKETGSDTTGTGSDVNPYASISKAVSELPRFLEGWYIILVHAGSTLELSTYREQVNVDGIKCRDSLARDGFLDIQAWYYDWDSGPVSSATPSTLTVPWSWYTTDQFKDKALVAIFEGKGAGQIRRVISNTANQLTVSPDWTVTPDTTSAFTLSSVTISGADSGAPTTPVREHAMVLQGCSNAEVFALNLEQTRGSAMIYNGCCEFSDAFSMIIRDFAKVNPGYGFLDAMSASIWKLSWSVIDGATSVAGSGLAKIIASATTGPRNDIIEFSNLALVNGKTHGVDIISSYVGISGVNSRMNLGAGLRAINSHIYLSDVTAESIFDDNDIGLLGDGLSQLDLMGTSKIRNNTSYGLLLKRISAARRWTSQTHSGNGIEALPVVVDTYDYGIPDQFGCWHSAG